MSILKTLPNWPDLIQACSCYLDGNKFFEHRLGLDSKMYTVARLSAVNIANHRKHHRRSIAHHIYRTILQQWHVQTIFPSPIGSNRSVGAPRGIGPTKEKSCQRTPLDAIIAHGAILSSTSQSGRFLDYRSHANQLDTNPRRAFGHCRKWRPGSV